MKKTIIIIISLVYIASIVIVNFFGLQVKQFDGVTYVDSIAISDVRLLHEIPELIEPKYQEQIGSDPWYIFDFVPAPDGTEYTSDTTSVQNNPNAVHIDYEVLPHIADERSVEFVFDKEAYKDYVVFDDLKNTFIFLKPNKSIYVTIRALDGSNKTVSFYLHCNPQKNK